MTLEGETLIRHYMVSILILVLAVLSMGQVSAFSIKDEIKLGQDVSKEVEKEMPLSKNEKWQKDIQALGQKFVPHVTRKDFTYQFRVVDAGDEINAFALPGGYVYFTERMWQIMTPDERAGIMAHEITHCDRRHAIDQMIKSQQRSLWTLPLVILGGGAGAGLLVDVGNAVISQRYSRKMEREADELGLKLDKAAGFNPAGMVTSMEKLLHVESNENHYEMSDILASHPDTKKRIEYLTQEALAMGAKQSEMSLKAVEDPDRIGNIVTVKPDMGIVYARCNKKLKFGEKVLIKKMLWDDNLGAITPKTVAIATVLTPGVYAGLIVDKGDKVNKTYYPGDVMEGDGIFPLAATQPVTVPLPESLEHKDPVSF